LSKKALARLMPMEKNYFDYGKHRVNLDERKVISSKK
jgi:hypothetical protein